MVFTSNITSTAEIWMKMGLGGNTTDFTDAMMTASHTHAMGVVNAASRYNWTDHMALTTTNSDVVHIIGDAVSSLIAAQGIKFDMRGYPSRIVAEDMINVERDNYLRNMSILRDAKTRRFIINA